jgi:dienelactone hydrolase
MSFQRNLSRAVTAGLLAAGLLTLSACKKEPDKSAASSQPVAEQTPKAPLTGQGAARKLVKGEEVTYQAGGVTLKGYLAYDTAQTGPRPGVLVVHEWWGHNDYARDRAKALAGLGYTALAVDMYGDGKQAKHPDDAKKFSGEVMGNMEEAKSRFVAAQSLLQQHATTDPTKTSAIGYCFGGGVVLHMARQGLDLDGVASFHGMLGSPTPATKVGARLLVLHGDADPFVPPAQVEAFKKEMAAAGANLKFIAYPGAKHAFTVPGVDEKGKEFSLPLAYDKAAADASWAELKGFLAEIYPAAG